MMRLAPTLVAAAFLAGSAGLAFAADATPPAQPPAAAPATPMHHHYKHMQMAHRQDAGRAEGNRMTSALNLLEAKGYGDFSHFKQDGGNFTATVNQRGQQFNVVIDPGSGQVTRQG
ncbi:MAG TPA: hypothetical protein VE397_20335 [Stellaceae bacterium]|jgi:hypothetical protein|nr:hypothetical protein [Stellaceae bacterium]